MPRKKLPEPVVIIDTPKRKKIKDWLHPMNPWLWSNRPSPEDIDEWNEIFEPPEDIE